MDTGASSQTVLDSQLSSRSGATSVAAPEAPPIFNPPTEGQHSTESPVPHLPTKNRTTPDTTNSGMARAPMTPTQAPPERDNDANTKPQRKSAFGSATSESTKPSKTSNPVVSPNDTEVDDEDNGRGLLDSDSELGTPLGVGGPAGFGDFDDEEYSCHRFLGPSVPGDATSARALHGLRRVMVHAKPPKFASDLSAMRASMTSYRTTALPSDFAGMSVRSQSLEQPLNSYQVTFRDTAAAGFTTRLSICEETAELAVRIATVERDSQAFKAGVVVGDTLLSINDNPIEPHMTEDQVEELMDSQRGARTIVFARACLEAPDRLSMHPRSHSDGVSKPSIFGNFGGGDKKAALANRFSKTKFSSALSYGGSMMAAKLKRKKSIVHKDVMCEGCGVASITGALWSCSVCASYHLCNDCYEVGTHGMENTEAMQALNEALVQYRLQKKCKRFTPEFLLSLRRDICKNRPDKFEYMGGWIADIVNGTAPSKITVRGIEIPHLPPTSRQRFVGKLMPLVSNRTDIEVHIEWLPDDSGERMSFLVVDRITSPDLGAGDLGRDSGSADGASAPQVEDLEKLRIWISDKKKRTASPFV